MTINPAAISALADAWASIDGKIDHYRFSRDNPGHPEAIAGGYYQGYQIEAEEMIVRLRKRGFDVVARP